MKNYWLKADLIEVTYCLGSEIKRLQFGLRTMLRQDGRYGIVNKIYNGIYWPNGAGQGVFDRILHRGVWYPTTFDSKESPSRGGACDFELKLWDGSIFRMNRFFVEIYDPVQQWVEVGLGSLSLGNFGYKGGASIN